MSPFEPYICHNKEELIMDWDLVLWRYTAHKTEKSWYLLKSFPLPSHQIQHGGIDYEIPLPDLSEIETTAKLEHNHPTEGEVEWVRSAAY